MNIRLNGESRNIDPDEVLLGLVAQVTGRPLNAEGRPVDGQRLGVAAAVNGEVVPRGSWAATALTGGDDVEIVTAVQGG